MIILFFFKIIMSTFLEWKNYFHILDNLENKA